MASDKQVQDNPARGQVVNPLPVTDHDRVVMPSLYADGSLAQTPGVELIGDPEVSRTLMQQQFAQQAVSAVDVAERGVRAGGGVRSDAPAAGTVDQDPEIKSLQDKHAAAAEAARAAADAAVDDLFTDDERLQTPGRVASSAPAGKSEG